MAENHRRGGFLKCIAVALVLALVAGILCNRFLFTDKENKKPETDTRSVEEMRQDFSAFIQQIFVEEVSDDSITLNYTIKNPSTYGIEDIEPTLGGYSLAELQESMLVSENRLASLETFDYEKLNEEQKLVYDILFEMLQQNLSASDFLEYSECLGPTSGIQAQLPVLLAEYNFNEKKDVETYIKLLGLVPDYFSQIASFEEKKSRDGLFMNDLTAQAIIDQCRKFVETSSENYLVTVFNKKIETVDGLNEDEVASFKEKNKQEVENSVISAYKNLIETLEGLKGTGKNDKGLCGFDRGRDYYSYLVKAKTGSGRSIQEIDTLLTNTLKDTQEEIAGLISKYPDVYYQAQEVKYPYTNPKKQLSYLEGVVAEDFPELSEEVNCEVKYVDSSLEESMSPAFYLTSPIDDYYNNVIYLNRNKEYDLSRAFSTIAHEGYPGHLYQHAYFLSTSPMPIRSVFHVGGYSEGWATYAELYSYTKAGLEEEVAKFLQKNVLATLCIYAKADIAINYQGWDVKKLASYLSAYGFDKSQSRLMYDTMVAEPASYMPYTLGYLEIDELKKAAKDALGGKFSLKAFHEFILSTGAAPFNVIEKHMQLWVKKQK